VKFAFMRDHRDRFDTDLMCRVLGVAPAGFYAWADRPESPRARRARALSEEIRVVHTDSRGIYGHRKVAGALRARGRKVNRKTVARLMAAAGLRSKVRRKFRVRTTDSNHGNPVAANTLARRFAVATPDTVWAADITYLRTGEGVLYLAGVMDLCSRRIVGWSMSAGMTTTLVDDALRMAVRARGPAPGLLHHSDRGVQYTSRPYRERLGVYGMRASMSRVGDCYDNAVVESFWGKLKTELVYHEPFPTMAAARAAVFDYIEVFYNRQRLHASLGYLSPAQFETRRT
jgi:transposase InsO family protein